MAGKPSNCKAQLTKFRLKHFYIFFNHNSNYWLALDRCSPLVKRYRAVEYLFNHNYSHDTNEVKSLKALKYYFIIM